MQLRSSQIVNQKCSNYFMGENQLWGKAVL